VDETLMILAVDIFLCTLANITLIVLNPSTSIDENGLLAVSKGSFVEIQCNSGADNLLWEISPGTPIMESNAPRPSFPVYQSRDPVNIMQILYIQNFSPADRALYTCKTDMFHDGILVEKSVYITNGT
jgi:hypothetical protein